MADDLQFTETVTLRSVAINPDAYGYDVVTLDTYPTVSRHPMLNEVSFRVPSGLSYGSKDRYEVTIRRINDPD